MLFGEILGVALSAIRANKLRSALTMLGIVIGVAAVIAMVALGSGAQKAVADQIQSLGTNLLSILPGQSFGGGAKVASDNRVSLKMDDFDALVREDVPSFQAVVPELGRNMQLKYFATNANESVVGTVPEYVAVNNYTITSGRNFTQADNASRNRVVVLGSSVPDILGANGPAMIGQTLAIGGATYEIIGILSSKGAQGFSNPDEQVLIPLYTARYRAFGTDRLRALTVQVTDADSIPVSMVEIESVLRRQHHIPPGGDNDFTIRNRAELLTTIEGTTKTFGFLLGGIAAVSLVVGGIGIMNIMLVSVTERTKEIGTRKALGATRRNIMLQFLIEAVVLCVMGGTLGIILGAGGAIALAKLAQWNTLVSPASIFLAFGFSAAVGIVFGLWPARRAASLDPIVALRYE
ncbi:MAG TPA: ABC transporter permease [Gemmatimonadales bacterium]|jgi:putative ABC transport system permease protein